MKIFSIIINGKYSSILIKQMSCDTSVDCLENVPFPPPCSVDDVDPTTAGVTDPPNFPLDPLTPSEQCQAVALTAADSRFPSDDPRTLWDRVELLQPTKAEVL